jgi:hypothetical protein
MTLIKNKKGASKGSLSLAPWLALADWVAKLQGMCKSMFSLHINT